MAGRSWTRAIVLPVLGLLADCATTAGADTGHYRVRTACGAMLGCFTGIQAALDAADRDTSGRWITVDIGAGAFREKVVLRRSRVRLVGSGAARTRLSFDAVAEHAGRYDRAHWGTAGSATLTIDADEVAVTGITIENAFDYLANDALPAGDPRKIGNSQGVAVMLDVHSDRVALDRVAILGYQDTLFTRGKRAVIRGSVIAGNIDFIFGNGTLLIEDSEVRTRRRAVPTPPDGFASFITAPSTQLSQPIGIVVYRSRLTREPGVEDASVALGRPWHPTTTFADGRYADPQAVGQAAFVDCTMDVHIHPDRWTGMAGTARDGTKSRIFLPAESRFAETGSRGPGARRNRAAEGNTEYDIAHTRKLIFAGWSPKG
ncbi:pectinesterase family protein [Sphingomonas ginsenosidivorax]|nr:pectinesterase family protein [Sphingomonas ginsenosidivorax]